MKQLSVLLLLAVAVFFGVGCSSSLNTGALGPQQKYEEALKLFNDEDYVLAIKELETILLQYSGTDVADDAQFLLARCRFEREEYILGAYEFSRLINNMPASEFVKESQYYLATCYYELSPHFTLDQKYSQKAIQEYQTYIDFFPTDPKVEEAEGRIREMNDKIAHKAYNDALIYEKMGYLIAAEMYFTNVIDTYHDTQYAPMASLKKINLLVSKDRKDDALKEIENFTKKYQSSPQWSDVAAIKKSLGVQ